MTVALRVERRWTADEFMVTDQHVFGDAWRYELVAEIYAFVTLPCPAEDSALV